ncbi:MAG: glycosyltransferase family 2 protein, partial [bacterium]|nr:glycosyltransferase family 2 protein [bacterium]
MNRVTVIIPHWNGEGILRRCLLSLRRTRGVRFRTLVVDNGCSDGSAAMVRRDFPEAGLVRSPENLGFAGGCNLGLRHADTPYAALLNNDAEAEPDWLRRLVAALDQDANLAAAAPKMLSLDRDGRFDYSGAAGGEMDWFGFPFCRGRIFDTVEEDEGQYDSGGPVFWATGAACLLRMSALARSGWLDESFFAHMEEIDLAWRLQAAGYGVAVVPSAVVRHRSGGTLGSERMRKMVLNHRNSLVMLIKNLPAGHLAWILPARLFLESAAAFGGLVLGQPKRFLAVPAAAAAVIGRLPSVLRLRRETQARAPVSYTHLTLPTSSER